MPIHLLFIAIVAFPTLAILTIMLTHIGPDIAFCRSLCEVYSIGCKYNSWLGCRFELEGISINATYVPIVVVVGVATALITVYLWISTLYVEVNQDGILVVKNFFLRRKTYIPRNEILHVYVQTPNPLGMWFRQGRSKAIIVHEKGTTVFALYSGDLIEFPEAVMKYVGITPSTIESAL